MGYGSYMVYRRGEEIEAGYLVDDVCNEEGCEEKIDRGLDYLCGQFPGGDEYGCGGYFCGAHLFFSSEEGVPQRCRTCCNGAPATSLPQAEESPSDHPTT